MLVWHLLTHSSGLTYDFMNQNVVDAEYRVQGITHPSPHKNLQTWVKALAEIPLIREPGTEWNYSVSTDVLGRLVEVWSGLPVRSQRRVHEWLITFHPTKPKLSYWSSANISS